MAVCPIGNVYEPGTLIPTRNMPCSEGVRSRLAKLSAIGFSYGTLGGVSFGAENYGPAGAEPAACSAYAGKLGVGDLAFTAPAA